MTLRVGKKVAPALNEGLEPTPTEEQNGKELAKELAAEVKKSPGRPKIGLPAPKTVTQDSLEAAVAKVSEKPKIKIGLKAPDAPKISLKTAPVVDYSLPTPKTEAVDLTPVMEKLDAIQIAMDNSVRSMLVDLKNIVAQLEEAVQVLGSDQFKSRDAILEAVKNIKVSAPAGKKVTLPTNIKEVMVEVLKGLEQDALPLEFNDVVQQIRTTYDYQVTIEDFITLATSMGQFDTSEGRFIPA